MYFNALGLLTKNKSNNPQWVFFFFISCIIHNYYLYLIPRAQFFFCVVHLRVKSLNQQVRMYNMKLPFNRKSLINIFLTANNMNKSWP